MINPTSMENSLFNGYLNLTSRGLNEGELVEHKKIVHEAIQSKHLSKDAVLKIMSTLQPGENGTQNFEYNQDSLERILKSCEDFTKEHCLGTKEIVAITDQTAVEKISDLICDILQLKPFTSGNAELSIILSSFLLNKIKKPFLIITNSDKNEFNEASTNKLAMRIFIANKYKQSFIRDKQIYKAIEVYENAIKYKSEEGKASCTVEWHQLNHAIDEWIKNLH